MSITDIKYCTLQYISIVQYLQFEFSILTMQFVDIDNSYCWYLQFEMFISTMSIKWRFRLPYWSGSFSSGEVQILPSPLGTKTAALASDFTVHNRKEVQIMKYTTIFHRNLVSCRFPECHFGEGHFAKCCHFAIARGPRECYAAYECRRLIILRGWTIAVHVMDHSLPVLTLSFSRIRKHECSRWNLESWVMVIYR